MSKDAKPPPPPPPKAPPERMLKVQGTGMDKKPELANSKQSRSDSKGKK